MSKLQVPANALQFRPVFVTAPTARNGITLLQRLLNSTRKIIVYGENSHFMEFLPQGVFEQVNTHQKFRDAMVASRKKFLTQTSEYWSSDLNPDPDVYLRLVVEEFYRFVSLYEYFGKQDGFSRWGIKHPVKSILHLDDLRTLLPKSRTVFVYRNLYDVARSIKARGWTKTPADFATLAARWQDNLCPLLQGTPPDLVLVRYEHLLENPEKELDRIEKHLGLQGIDRSVLQKKINTFQGSGEGQSPSGYVEPEVLTTEEKAALAERGSQGLSAAGYQDPDRA